MDDDQIEQICQAIKTAFRFQNADVFEHVFGPFQEEHSLAAGVHRVADALDRIADKLGDDGALNEIGGHVDRIADAVEALEKKTDV